MMAAPARAVETATDEPLIRDPFAEWPPTGDDAWLRNKFVVAGKDG
jgi:O-methyltransferase involved in polyketide biosynthesis